MNLVCNINSTRLFSIGVQATHGKETKSSHKQVFGPVKISSGELLQHKCEYADCDLDMSKII